MEPSCSWVTSIMLDIWCVILVYLFQSDECLQEDDDEKDYFYDEDDNWDEDDMAGIDEIEDEECYQGAGFEEGGMEVEDEMSYNSRPMQRADYRCVFLMLCGPNDIAPPYLLDVLTKYN